MGSQYVTVTGFRHYYDLKPFAIGQIIRCEKEPTNPYDSEAIRCSLPAIGTVGYIANSHNTRANGTQSAGRIYDRVENIFYIKVMFTTHTKVICRLLPPTVKHPERAMLHQMEQNRGEDYDPWFDEF
ncbi:MAG: HIRAN domain-containing protein [Oscillospiraceae bacterium]|nr:HIRAN domain-containing protein [Oscillospiraceae bacterium]